jgi:hypothetical protein
MRPHEVSGRVTYTPDSIARALDHHTRRRAIRWWDRRDERYRVGLNTGAHDDVLDLRSHREAWLLVAGLASAQHTPEPKEQ